METRAQTHPRRLQVLVGLTVLVLSTLVWALACGGGKTPSEPVTGITYKLSVENPAVRVSSDNKNSYANVTGDR